MIILFPKDEKNKEVLLDLRDATDQTIEKKDLVNYVIVVGKADCVSSSIKSHDYESVRDELKSSDGAKILAKNICEKFGKGTIFKNFVKSLQNGRKILGWSGEGKLNLLSHTWGDMVQSIVVANVYGNVFWEQGKSCPIRLVEDMFDGQKVAYGMGFDKKKAFETISTNQKTQ